MENSDFIPKKLKKPLAIASFILAMIVGISQIPEVTDKLKNIWDDLNPYSESNSDLPINIGDDFISVYNVLGQPQERHHDTEIFLSHGLNVSKNYPLLRLGEEVVGGVTVENDNSIATYKNFINTIKLGMTFNDIKDKLGEPSYLTRSDLDKISLAIWTDDIDDELATIVYFKQDKNTEAKADKISFTEVSSFPAYQAVVEATIQELRAGRISPFVADSLKSLESDNEVSMTLNNFANNYLFQNYKFEYQERGMFGEIYVYLQYENKDILSFHVYPVGGSLPNINFISKLEQSSE